jgi:predicted O-methyltransferase YrrM
MFGGRLSRLAGLYLLPPSARRFYLAAESEAQRAGYSGALIGSAGVMSLAAILHWARGRHRVAEVGTSAGWTALALAAADPGRHVITVDPFPHPHMERYRRLVPDAARRVEFVTGYGEDGPPPGRTFDFLFLDEAHERPGLVASFRAWRPALDPGALVVFHDYGPGSGWPGVAGAVEELGLDGHVRSGAFLWTAPG